MQNKWEQDSGKLVKNFRFQNFKEAIIFMKCSKSPGIFVLCLCFLGMSLSFISYAQDRGDLKQLI